MNISPIPPSPDNASLHALGRAAEEQLLEQVTELYSWYVSSSWYSSDQPAFLEGSKELELTRNLLTQIKRIAEVSFTSGKYLSSREIGKISHTIQELAQDLNSGKLRKNDLPIALFQLINDLTQQNPKAKVISQTTELEYLLCINPEASQPPELTEQYKKMLAQIIVAITPELNDLNASAVAQGLGKIIADLNRDDDISKAITSAIKHWI